jgi:glucan phosphoethanolaminetransferase (alkaline phosphatase superfamily)
VKRRIAAIACAALFATQYAALDFALRRPAWREWIAGAAASAALGLLLASLSERRAVRIAVSLVTAFLLVVQLVFFRYYHVFLDDHAMAAARHMWGDVRPTVVRVLPTVVGVSALAAVLEFEALTYSARAKSAAMRGVLGAIFAASAFFALRAHATSPELSALASLRVFARAPEARAATSVQIPALGTTRARIPNVLFILDESVRASDYDALTAPETASLTRGRADLRQMRSVASYTAIAVSSLLTSLPPTSREDALKRAPYVFDFARSVQSVSQRVHVAYYSSQTDSLFERRDVRAATDAFVTVDDLVGHKVDDLDDVIDSGVDRLLASRVEYALPRLEKPFFAMVHLSGTHAPYFVDDTRAPFRPYRHSVSWSGLDELHAAYRDAIYEQDRSVARVLRTFYAACGDEPCVVVFTSDHGEAFGEHSAIHHGQSLYDEQIHVPAWIYERNGGLGREQAAALFAHEDDFVTHLDIVPTLLDAYGVLEASAMREWARGFGGHSLLRSGRAEGAIAITNCTDMFPCPVATWGVLSGSRLLEAQQWDDGWRCVDLRANSVQTDDPSCAVLRDASRAFFPTLPNGRDNR